MARILVASVPDGAEFVRRIMRQDHELVFVTRTHEAVAKLTEEDFDLIMIGVHFDESRMFELLSHCKTIARNADKPIITFCTRDTPLTRAMHDSIEVTVKAYGAWIYLDQHDYNVKKDPDAEIRRVIERCLISTERKKTKQKRIDLQKRREELLQLRLALGTEEWSVDLEDRVADLRQKLSDVLLELSETLKDSIRQQEKLAESKDLEDRVSAQAKSDENTTAREERQIMLEESRQLAKEQELARREEEKAKKLRHQLLEIAPIIAELSTGGVGDGHSSV
jgi:CheY-like chemotaxis protein